MEIYSGTEFRQVESDFLQEALSKLRYSGQAPFNEAAKAVLKSLSRQLLKLPKSTLKPEFTVLGFWLRPARLEVLERQFQSKMPEQLSLISVS